MSTILVSPVLNPLPYIWYCYMSCMLMIMGSHSMLILSYNWWANVDYFLWQRFFLKRSKEDFSIQWKQRICNFLLLKCFVFLHLPLIYFIPEGLNDPAAKLNYNWEQNFTPLLLPSFIWQTKLFFLKRRNEKKESFSFHQSHALCVFFKNKKRNKIHASPHLKQIS